VAAPERIPDAPLTSSAIEEARRRGFYPLVQLLERLSGGPPVGTSDAAPDERIRFRHDPALSFSTGDVVRVREVAPGPTQSEEGEGARARTFEVTTTFLGLTGGVSPLPNYLAEEVAQQDPDDPRLRDFLDLFHHRLISFVYRARAKYDAPASWRSDLTDAWSPRLFALLGIDAWEPAVPGPPRWQLLRLAPLLADREVTSHTLEVAIREALGPDLGGARVAVEPFVGGWVDIAPEDRNRLGRSPSRIGVDLVLGRRVVDVAGRFRVVIGPLSAESYPLFVGGEPVRRAEAMIAGLVAEPIEHEIVLWLSEDAAPPVRLGRSRLGKDSWLGGQRRQIRIRADRAA
jgi:type VI secretion system protein ImpH